MGFMALITAVVLCARFQNSLISVSVRMVRVVSSNAGFKGGGKPCPKTHETTAAERHSESLAHLAGFKTKPLVH